jgi:hypothetical protein
MPRVKRRIRERLFNSEAYACMKCGERDTLRRRSLLSIHARCPRCHSFDLRERSKRDSVDRMNRNPLRLIQRFLGARLYHCEYCRLQFYDLRPPLYGD